MGDMKAMGLEGDAGANRGLLRLVYIMGVVLVLLFLLLVAGIVWKAARPKPVAMPADMALSLGLNAADVTAVSLDGGQLMIRTGKEIIVINVSNRKVLLREPLAP